MVGLLYHQSSNLFRNQKQIPDAINNNIIFKIKLFSEIDVAIIITPIGIATPTIIPIIPNKDVKQPVFSPFADADINDIITNIIKNITAPI